MRGRVIGSRDQSPEGMHFILFTAQTHMSGVDFNGTAIRTGSPDTVIALVQSDGNHLLLDSPAAVNNIANMGGTPLVVTRNNCG